MWKPVAIATVALALVGCHPASAQTACPGIGTSFSVNAPSVPVSGYVLLVTIPVTCYRSNVEIQNQSTSEIQLVRDDGNGNNQTSIFLDPAASTYTQGGAWSSKTFKGRLRIYGASSGIQLSAFQE